MKTLKTAALLAALLSVSAGARLAAQERGYVVVVNPSNELASVSVDELSQLFLKRTAQWTSGQPVVPVDLAERSMTRANFSQEVHRKTTTEIRSFWQAAVFAGRAVPPTEAASEQAALELVRSTPGAIGYVHVGTPLGEGVRVVRVRS